MLQDIIIEKIKNNGPLSFHDFMEMALYYPEIGYYTSDKIKIGKYGDYYTSPSATPLFGEMIGKQLEEMWLISGEENFTVIEYGAGNGSMAFNILQYATKENKKFYDNITYLIIEKSDAMKQLQQSILSEEKITWLDSITNLSKITGCILSNEVLDNFSVHRVIMQDNLMEIFVDYNNGFKEIILPAGEPLKNYFKALNVMLPKGFSAEINLEAIDWLQGIAISLHKGFVLTIDYGYSSSNYFNSKAKDGTLSCYKDHTFNNCPYNNIGHQDITAHVNFSALCYWGKIFGLEYSGFVSQANFLKGLGLTNYLRKMEQKDIPCENDKQFILNNFLWDMGSKFKILIQHKNLKRPFLSGLSFCEYLY